MSFIKTDVLVIGSGGAGCSAAIEASKHGLNVTIITKSDFLNSKTSRAQGGIQAAIGKDDSPEAHFEDTLKAGEYENNKALVKILTDKAPSTVEWLEQTGVVFDRDGDRYKLQGAAGLSHKRILSCGDKSGNRLMAPIKQAVQEKPINIFEFTAPLKIDVNEDGSFQLILKSKGKNDTFDLHCNAIVLACGGYVPQEKKSGMATNAVEAIPDIFDLVKEIGLEIVFPDLMQYHPTGIVSPKAMRRMRVPETFRSAGANLLNKDLKAFCDPLTTRNKLTAIIAEECKNGNGVSTEDGRVGVWLNTPRIEELNGAGYIQKNFPGTYANFLKEGVNIAEEMVLVYPILHYSLGGIKIDENTETSVKGIFSAGEATYGVHGKDRLMGNSLLEIFVFGRRAGVFAANHCLNKKSNIG